MRQYSAGSDVQFAAASLRAFCHLLARGEGNQLVTLRRNRLPGIWAMMIAGFGLAGMATRMRRRTVATPDVAGIG